MKPCVYMPQKWPPKQWKAWGLLFIDYFEKKEKQKSSGTIMEGIVIWETIIKVERIAVKIIAILCLAPLQTQILLPKWLELPNQLPQKTRSMATIQLVRSSFDTHSSDCRPITWNSLPQLHKLNPPRHFHLFCFFPTEKTVLLLFQGKSLAWVAGRNG